MTDARPVYLVINRWDDEFAEYHRFVDPASSQLCYITTESGLARLDRGSARAITVLDELDYPAVHQAAAELHRQVGNFDRIAGISEYDLQTAARLRDEFRVPGDTSEFVVRFKDKVVMKRLVSAAGIRVPRFISLPPDVTEERVVNALGLPFILKPRVGAGSERVEKVGSIAELRDALARCELAEFECEEYIDGDIFHVDGVRRSGQLCFVSVSAYINTCLDFALGKPLGSVLLDPGQKRDTMIAFSERCLDALGMADGVFHLELIDSADGDLVFLEVGLRCGGGEIPFIHRDLFSVDLPAESFRATLGVPPLVSPDTASRSVSGGFVMVPEPRPFPSRVTARSTLAGDIPGLYREILPEIGEVFDGKGGYEHIGGRFHLSGTGERMIRSSIREIFARYHLSAESCAADATGTSAQDARKVKAT